MGKTFLASAVIEELEKTGPVLYVYCDSKCTTARGILELLAAQSIRQISKCPGWRLRPDIVKFDFSEEFSNLERKDSYRIDDLPELITKLTKIFEASFIVVDALDECSDKVEMSHLIRTLLGLSNERGAKVFLTSREEQFFLDHLKSIPQDARISLNTENPPDIRLYISNALDELLGLYHCSSPPTLVDELRTEITNGLMAKANGM